jgi:transcriptional regulator
VAHLSGKLEASTDETFLASIVDRLSVRHETAIGSDWRYQHEREAHRSQLRGIIGFRFVPDRIELKFKLSQNHPAANVRGAAQALREQDDLRSRDVATMMLERLDRRPPD